MKTPGLFGIEEPVRVDNDYSLMTPAKDLPPSRELCISNFLNYNLSFG